MENEIFEIKWIQGHISLKRVWRYEADYNSSRICHVTINALLTLNFPWGTLKLRMSGRRNRYSAHLFERPLCVFKMAGAMCTWGMWRVASVISTFWSISPCTQKADSLLDSLIRSLMRFSSNRSCIKISTCREPRSVSTVLLAHNLRRELNPVFTWGPAMYFYSIFRLCRMRKFLVQIVSSWRFWEMCSFSMYALYGYVSDGVDTIVLLHVK